MPTLIRLTLQGFILFGIYQQYEFILFITLLLITIALEIIMVRVGLLLIVVKQLANHHVKVMEGRKIYEDIRNK